MIEAKNIPELPAEDVISLVREGKTHQYYGQVVGKARIMRNWYSVNRDINNLGKSEIIRRSNIESDSDYAKKLENLDLIPFEYKFIQTQQRIYDENNVQREYNSFWKDREAHFDDQGDEIDVFFRDKVLFTKEVEGFGAICLDLATIAGKTVSTEGKPHPYPYVVQAEELMYFKTWYGHLQIVTIAQKKNGKVQWRAFTPNFVYVFEDQDAQPVRVPHNFGQAPVHILKGALDPSTGYKVGMPRRWNLTGLYTTASELLYDLKSGSKLFGLPIPAVPFEMLRQISGAYDHEKETFNAEVIKQELGMVVGYSSENPPSKLFYQASMEGLQHIRGVIFEDLVNLVYQLAQVRDKSKVVHNASGRSKQFDSVEEQGLLAQTAIDMEAIERNVFKMMAAARGETPEDFNIVYSKHHDLSSADEIWRQFTEGLQYGGVPLETLGYLNSEFLRKKSAPKEVQDAAKQEIETHGFPMSAEQIQALQDRVDDAILIGKVRPELANVDTLTKLNQTLDSVRDILLTTNNQTQ